MQIFDVEMSYDGYAAIISSSMAILILIACVVRMNVVIVTVMDAKWVPVDCKD